jgi:hypothetical protein
MNDLHITNAMPEFFAKWRSEGIKGIHVHDMQLETNTVEDWVSEGRTAEAWNAHFGRYCIFLLYPDFETPMFGHSSSELITVEPDYDGFRTEVERQLRERFGENLVCNWSFDGNELEIGYPDALKSNAEPEQAEKPKVSMGEALNTFFKAAEADTPTHDDEIYLLRKGLTNLAAKLDPETVSDALKAALTQFREEME